MITRVTRLPQVRHGREEKEKRLSGRLRHSMSCITLHCVFLCVHTGVHKLLCIVALMFFPLSHFLIFVSQCYGYIRFLNPAATLENKR